MSAARKSRKPTVPEIHLGCRRQRRTFPCSRKNLGRLAYNVVRPLPPPHPVPQPRGGPCRERRNRKETRCATGANRSERSFPTPTAAAALRFFKTALSDVSDNLTRRPQCRWLPHRWRPAGCQRKWLQPPSSNCMIVRCTGHAICR